MDDLEYIVKGALMMCDQSDTPMFFSPTYSQVTNTKIQKLYIATTDDATPITHIPSFLLCKKTQKPCIPGTSPGAWKDPWPIKIKDKQALIGRCTCPCTLGGTIEFITSGQIPLDDETKKEIEEMQEDGQRELDDMGYGNSVGECGFVEGMIPIWGSGKDMINDIQTGDVGGAFLNGAFLIWDVGSIAVGIFSAGTGTVAMQGAKGGAKATVKSLGKKILGGAKSAGKWIKGLFKSSADDVAEVAMKKTLKETAKSGAKALKEALKSKIDDIAKKLGKSCVFACFPAGTKVHTENGLKNIEDICISDRVWSYNEKTGEISLQEVLSTVINISDHLVRICTEDEIIETTTMHPFYTNKGWKDAGSLETDEYLKTKNGISTKIKKVNFNYLLSEVYNLEVANWHTFFVGTSAILVHNGKCLSIIKNNIDEVITKYADGHIFSADHIKGGIMDLGKDKNDIIHSISSKIKDVDASGLLKEGSNQIRTSINGVESEIRVFIKDGSVLSVDAFKGYSSRDIGNIIIK